MYINKCVNEGRGDGGEIIKQRVPSYCVMRFVLIIRRQAGSTRTDTLVPYTTLLRSQRKAGGQRQQQDEQVKASGPVQHVAVGRIGPRDGEIGRAHVCTPVTNAHVVCRPLLEKRKSGDPTYLHTASARTQHNQPVALAQTSSRSIDRSNTIH